MAPETLWLARGSPGLAALTNIRLQLFFGMVAAWIGDLLAHHVEVDLTTALGTNREENEFIFYTVHVLNRGNRPKFASDSHLHRSGAV